MAFQVPPLPYPSDALAPNISEETVNIHYGRHHTGYVNKLNTLTQSQADLAEMPLEDIITTRDGKAFNLAAQAYNHAFYWQSMTPEAHPPTGRIAELIDRDFGSFEDFKTAFATVAGGHFGSGWCWLVWDPSAEKLAIVDTHDAGNPLTMGLKPLLVLDVWEHAYYVDYRNARGTYIQNFWNVANWDFVNANLPA